MRKVDRAGAATGHATAVRFDPAAVPRPNLLDGLPQAHLRGLSPVRQRHGAASSGRASRALACACTLAASLTPEGTRLRSRRRGPSPRRPLSRLACATCRARQTANSPAFTSPETRQRRAASSSGSIPSSDQKRDWAEVISAAVAAILPNRSRAAERHEIPISGSQSDNGKHADLRTFRRRSIAARDAGQGANDR